MLLQYTLMAKVHDPAQLAAWNVQLTLHLYDVAIQPPVPWSPSMLGQGRSAVESWECAVSHQIL